MTNQQEADERRRLEALAAILISSAISTMDKSLVAMFRSVSILAVDGESRDLALAKLKLARALGWDFVRDNAITESAGIAAYNTNDIDAYAAESVRRIIRRSTLIAQQARLSYTDVEINEADVIETTLKARRAGRVDAFSSDAVNGSVELGKLAVIRSIIGSTVITEPVTKTWDATLDAVTRTTHYIADGQEVGVDEFFMVGGYQMIAPRDRRAPAQETEHCRCQTVYSIPWSKNK